MDGKKNRALFFIAQVVVVQMHCIRSFLVCTRTNKYKLVAVHRGIEEANDTK